MSISTIMNSISSTTREIDKLETQIISIESNISQKTKYANSILEKINREKDLKRIIYYQKDYARKLDEVNRLNKDKTSKHKTLSEKQLKKIKLQQDLNKENEKDRLKVKKEQKELLSIQEKITREMQMQKSIFSNRNIVMNSENNSKKIKFWRKILLIKNMMFLFHTHQKIKISLDPWLNP